MRGDLSQGICHRALCVPQVIGDLHPQPKPWTVPAPPTQAQCHCRGYRHFTRHYAMQRLARNPQFLCRVGDRHIQRWQHIFSEDFTRVSWAASCYCVRFLRHVMLSMILLKRYVNGVTRFKFERDSPRAIDCHCPALGLSLQRVKIPTRDVHVGRCFCFIQRIENSQAPFLLIWTHLGACASLE